MLTDIEIAQQCRMRPITEIDVYKRQDIGGFGGLFAPDLTGMTEPVLVSGTEMCIRDRVRAYNRTSAPKSFLASPMLPVNVPRNP